MSGRLLQQVWRGCAANTAWPVTLAGHAEPAHSLSRAAQDPSNAGTSCLRLLPLPRSGHIEAAQLGLHCLAVSDSVCMEVLHCLPGFLSRPCKACYMSAAWPGTDHRASSARASRLASPAHDACAAGLSVLLSWCSTMQCMSPSLLLCLLSTDGCHPDGRLDGSQSVSGFGAARTKLASRLLQQVLQVCCQSAAWPVAIHRAGSACAADWPDLHETAAPQRVLLLTGCTCTTLNRRQCLGQCLHLSC